MSKIAQMRPHTEGKVETGDLAHSLGYLLRIAQIKVFDQFFEVLGEYDLRPGEFSVLWTIHLNPSIRQGVLAQSLHIKLAHMTKTIRRLEDRGLVNRAIPEDDRRAIHLTLSHTGAEFVTAHQELFFGSQAYLRHDLSDGEEIELVRLLRRFCGLQDDSSTAG